MGLFDFLSSKDAVKSAPPTSIHPSTTAMIGRTMELGIPTTFTNYKNQQPQCHFGVEGVCCQLCSHGPCRISDKAPLGICGINADGIVARNLAKLAAHGASTHSHQLLEGVKTLRAIAQGKSPFTIKAPEKLNLLAAGLGISTEGKDINAIALEVADGLEHEVQKSNNEPLKIAEALAPESRKKIWKNLGIFPGGVSGEVLEIMTKSMTNINTDPVDLLLSTMRLSLSSGYMGLVAINVLQDAILGNPGVNVSQADLGVIDPKTVNIVAHGHIPYMGTAVLKEIAKPEVQAAAKAVGAEGIKLYGSMDTGQEMMGRLNGEAKFFGGQLGNWIDQEMYVSTGAIELVMMDLNCTIPNLQLAASKFHTKLVPVSRVVRMPNVDTPLDYNPETVSEQAKELVQRAIAAYKERDAKKVFIPPQKSAVVAGIGIETILGVLGGSLKPLIDNIVNGNIKGVAAVVGCATNRDADAKTVALTKELIKRNILVINSGCASSATQKQSLMTLEAADLAGDKLKGLCKALGIPPVLSFGSCIDIGRIGYLVTVLAGELGVDPSQLPVAASAPEYLEQKAIIDGFFAVSFGLFTHLGPLPPVTGSALVAKILTQDVEGLTGGKVCVEQDTIKAADAIEAHINLKRAALGLPSGV